jgi:hypothetical protein
MIIDHLCRSLPVFGAIIAATIVLCAGVLLAPPLPSARMYGRAAEPLLSLVPGVILVVASLAYLYVVPVMAWSELPW